MRSGLDPVECLKKLEGRVISCTSRISVGRAAATTCRGAPAWATSGMLAELKRQNFKGAFSIEYEYHDYNPTPEVEKCVEAFHKFAKELGVKTGK